MENTNTPRSNVLPACIIAVGLIISAVIIAKPKLPLVFPPVSTASVEQQFTSQMQSQLSGRQVTIWRGDKTTLKRLEVEGVKYDADKKQYNIRYNLYWNNPSRSVSGTGCFLSSTDSETFSGNCNTGEEHVKNGYTRSVTVPISVK